MITSTPIARRLFVATLCLASALVLAVEPAVDFGLNKKKELLMGPKSPADAAAWRAAALAHRAEGQALMKAARGDLADPYAEPALQWAQRSFVQPQMMAHDRFFYDPVKGHYTVDRYLDDLAERYGGIDSVLVWPTYPNIGVDNRNQFDLWRDMPGGLDGVRGMVADFHRRGVRVLIPIMIWDTGTRDEGVPMEQGLAELAARIGADGLNGDTMSPVPREFYTASLQAGRPLALEPESGLAEDVGALAWNVLGWGYWWPYQPQPGVDRYKFIEPRRLTHVCDRWAHDRTDVLQYAFFNGDGHESWENVWGIWNGITPRDAEATRGISAIYRALPELLVSADYEPYAPTLQPGVFATKFPGKDATLWTIVNRGPEMLSGPQLRVDSQPGLRFFDLWRGVELRPETSGGTATLSFDLEARGYGAVVAVAAPDAALQGLLAAMDRRASIRLDRLAAEWKFLPQRLTDIAPTKPAAAAPEGMVLIPGGAYDFQTEGVMIERSEGVDVQFPWEDKPVLKHRHELQLKPYYIDRTPVTCAEFKRFLDATNYHPADDHNFLKNWSGRNHPEGWEKKPVTWVSLEDARAYAQWAGKRLPHEWEWQYAAQGADGRRFPWGGDDDPRRRPELEQGREQRPPSDVDAFPEGASPFGVLDLLGNVWQWTDEFSDGHTRAAILKGGSHYRPDQSKWYFPQARELGQHGKYLLMAPSIDRSATIGFRCVTDASQP